MKEKLKNALIAVVCGAFLSSCISYNNQEKIDYSPFVDRKEFFSAIESYKRGWVNEGDWIGLRLRKIGGNNLEGVLGGIDSENKNVKNNINLIKNNILNFDSLDNLQKAKEIYSFLRKDFSYEQNPFEKLLFVGEDVFYKEKQGGVLSSIRSGGLDAQSIDETHRYKRGDCDSLSSLLASHFIHVGVESRLVLVSVKNPERGKEDFAHVVVFFKNGLIKDGQECGNILDPSYFKDKNFVENIILSSEYLNANNFDIGFLN